MYSCFFDAAGKKFQFLDQVLGVAAVVVAVIHSFHNAFDYSNAVLLVILLHANGKIIVIIRQMLNDDSRDIQTVTKTATPTRVRRTHLAGHHNRFQFRVRRFSVVFVQEHLYNGLPAFFG